MKFLTETRRIRFSKDDTKLMDDLRKKRVKVTVFIRDAFREKIQRDMPKILEAEAKRKQKTLDNCPF